MNVFKDSRELEEYIILKEIIQISSIGNMSHASVKFVFRRRIEYHVTKTFLQVFVKSKKCISNPYFMKYMIFVADLTSGYDWLFIILL